MGDNENKQLLKDIAQGKKGKQSSWGASVKIPGSEQVSKLLKHAKPKVVVDIALFSVGILLMYKFGKIVAEELDSQMPTEKSMMEMMKSMQPQPGMPPMP